MQGALLRQALTLTDPKTIEVAKADGRPYSRLDNLPVCINPENTGRKHTC